MDFLFALECSPGFVPLSGRCFLINTTKADHHSALQNCISTNASLAKIDRKYVRKSISKYLDRQNLTKYHIGLEAKNKWLGSYGRVVVKNGMWAKGYPVQTEGNEVLLDSSLSKLVNKKFDGSNVGGLCVKQKCKCQK